MCGGFEMVDGGIEVVDGGIEVVTPANPPRDQHRAAEC